MKILLLLFIPILASGMHEGHISRHHIHGNRPDNVIINVECPAPKKEEQRNCCCGLSENMKIALISSGIGLLSALVTAAITIPITLTQCTNH